MTNQEVAKVLAEKLRTDLDLRRSLGMEEGSDSGLSEEDDTEVFFTDGDGVSHAIVVEDM